MFHALDSQELCDRQNVFQRELFIYGNAIKALGNGFAINLCSHTFSPLVHKGFPCWWLPLLTNTYILFQQKTHCCRLNGPRIMTSISVNTVFSSACLFFSSFYQTHIISKSSHTNKKDPPYVSSDLQCGLLHTSAFCHRRIVTLILKELRY